MYWWSWWSWWFWSSWWSWWSRRPPDRLLTGNRVWVSPRAPDSPDRSCQEPVSTARRHKQFADVAKLYKVLVRIIYRVIIVFNFYIYKKLFSLISLTFKIFYPFILNQKALKIGYSNFLIPNILYTLVKLIIYLHLSI